MCDSAACPQIYRYYSTLSYVPIILCLVVLSLWYPALLIRSFTGHEETLDKEVTKMHGVTGGGGSPGEPLDDPVWFQGCFVALLPRSLALSIGVLPVLPVWLPAAWRPSDGSGAHRGCGSVYLAGFEEGKIHLWSKLLSTRGLRHQCVPFRPDWGRLVSLAGSNNPQPFWKRRALLGEGEEKTFRTEPPAPAWTEITPGAHFGLPGGNWAAFTAAFLQVSGRGYYKKYLRAVLAKRPRKER